MFFKLCRRVLVLVGIFMLVPVPANAESPWLDKAFVVPEHYSFGDFSLVKVNPALAEQDYQALMQARMQIRKDLATTWPEDALTLAQNRESLVRDLQSFEQRQSFTYHLLERQSGRVIGCVYLSPNAAKSNQTSLYYWLVPSYYQSGNHTQIRKQIYDWVNNEWPFKTVDVSLNAAL